MGVHCRVKSLCPRPWEESFHSSQLSHGVSPLHISQRGVRSSSSLWTSRTSSLTNSCSSNMVGCLNPYSTEPYKSSACNSLTGIPILASWESESGDPGGVNCGQRIGSFCLSPTSSSRGSSSSEKVPWAVGGPQKRAVSCGCVDLLHTEVTVISKCSKCLVSLPGCFPTVPCDSKTTIVPGLI